MRGARATQQGDHRHANRRSEGHIAQRAQQSPQHKDHRNARAKRGNWHQQWVRNRNRISSLEAKGLARRGLGLGPNAGPTQGRRCTRARTSEEHRSQNKGGQDLHLRGRRLQTGPQTDEAPHVRQTPRAPTAPTRTRTRMAANTRRHRTAPAEAIATPDDLHPHACPLNGIHAPGNGQTAVASNRGGNQAGHTNTPAHYSRQGLCTGAQPPGVAPTLRRNQDVKLGRNLVRPRRIILNALSHSDPAISGIHPERRHLARARSAEAFVGIQQAVPADRRRPKR